MKRTLNFKQKYVQFIIILIPIFITQVTLSLMTFFDTFMSGHASASDLAGVAIGSSLWLPIQTGLSGILLGVTPLISELLGAGHKDKIAYNVIQALMLSLAVSALVLLAGGIFLSPILDRMGLTPEVTRVAFYFLIAISTGVIPLFGYTVLRSFIDALGKTRTSMIITLVALPINVVINYLLIFGKLGLPRLGGIGAGVATAITYWILFLLSVFIIHRSTAFASFSIFRKWYAISLGKWKELLKLGIPIGFAIFFETSVFAAVTLLMSNFDTTTIAAHQAANNFATTLYMIPLSICMALTILVGYESGAKRMKDAKQYGAIGIGTAITFSVVTAILLMVFRQNVAEIYSSDAPVVMLIKQFLVYAVFFQMSDAVATPVQGVLRGYKDVNTAFILTLISYWIIGLPLGYVLAKYTEYGPFGYWIGLITGLAIAAALLLWRLSVTQRRLELKLERT